MKSAPIGPVRACVSAVTAGAVVFALLCSLGYVRGRYVMWRVPVAERVVALTFDDGPHAEFTDRMLDELDLRDIPATFFVVGSEVESNPDVLRRIIANGHEVGNHTQTHDHMDKLDGNMLGAELAACEAVIEAAGGVPSRWYRPPRGHLSLAHEWSAARAGLRIAMWSHCLESSRYEDPLSLAEALEPGDIVLIHDGRLDRSSSVDALPVFLDAAVARGFRFVTLSELESLGARPVIAGLIPGLP